MEQAQQIERFERLRDWAVLAIWSPGLWLMLPLIIMLQTSALWSPSNRVLDILANIWMIGLFFLMVLCIIGAFAFTNVRSRIETMCGDFDEISRVPHAPQVGPLRVRAVSNSTILVVRHFAPSRHLDLGDPHPVWRRSAPHLPQVWAMELRPHPHANRRPFSPVRRPVPIDRPLPCLRKSLGPDRTTTTFELRALAWPASARLARGTAQHAAAVIG